MVSVFSYDNPRQFLLDSLAERQAREPGFSVRALARDMELKSHALLVMLLQGKRPLRVKHAGFLAKGFGLSSQERLYLQALIQFDSAEDPEEQQLCRLWLSDLNPEHDFQIHETSEYAVISQWLHMVILAMTELRDFSPAADKIAKRLKGKVSVHEVRAALTRLFDLKLLQLRENGRVESSFQRVTTKDDVVNLAARQYHKEMSDLAKAAVDELPIELAKEMIRKFRASVAKAVSSNPGDEIYQMNIQFFRLTESPVAKTEDEGVRTESTQTSNNKGGQSV